MKDRSTKELEIFSGALALPASERAAYLARACGDDPVLRGRLQALLDAHAQATGFMEGAAIAAARNRDEVIGEKVGDRLGRYKLTQRLGEGGCGVVFLAEQEEPVRRLVALKVIKPGTDTKSVIARFEAERQALAMMEHPNIAQVHDAGATESGRPYFVMEWVRGVKITDYCDQHALSTGARLALFVQVCHAVQHAHRKGIIHRDLKPSNILVATSAEGQPQPKVIDFGIAKATTGQTLTDKTIFTAFEMLIGTPAYMSPEQASRSSADLDKRTDVYSLGVLLYELLTGTTPFDTRELLQSGLDEMRRVIRDEEPARPSTRLSGMIPGELLSVSHHRQSEPPKLIREMRGDLDWIVMKALEKDRKRRYATAISLAEDIQHYLANEGISARPPSAVYRVRKLIARHRGFFTAIGAILFFLAAGLSVALWSLGKERLARHDADAARASAEADKLVAQTAAAKSEQVTQFLKEMLKGVGPSVARGRDSTMLREILDRAVAHVDEELALQPRIQLELRALMAGVYRELGKYDAAEVLFRKALEASREQFGRESKETAAALSRLGHVLILKREGADAEHLYREALAIWRKIRGAEDPEIAASLKDLAGALWIQDRRAEAKVLAQQALEMRRKLLGPESLELADSLNFQAMILLNENKLEEATALEQQVLAIRRQGLAEDDLTVLTTINNLSLTLGHEGKFTEAEMLARQALEMRRKLLGDDHPDVAYARFTLSMWLIQLGRLPEAEELLQQAARVMRSALSPGDPDKLATLINLGRVLQNEKKMAEAEAVNREVLALRKSRGDTAADIADALDCLAKVLKEEGKLAEAEDFYRQELAALRDALPDDDPHIATTLDNVLNLLMREKKTREAEQVVESLLTPGSAANPRHASYFKARASLRARLGRWKEAAADVATALQHHPDDYQCYHMLAPLLVQTHDVAGYEKLCHTIVAQFRGTANPMVADPMAKDCLILPMDGLDLPAVVGLADTAVKGGQGKLALPYFLMCKGLAEYRQGHFAEAIEWCQKSHRATVLIYARAEALPIEAMACFHLGKTEAAKDRLAEMAEHLRTELPARESKDFGVDWRDWIIAQTLFSEASALINGQPSADTNQAGK